MRVAAKRGHWLVYSHDRDHNHSRGLRDHSGNAARPGCGDGASRRRPDPIWFDLGHMRGSGESHSDVIIRLAEEGNGGAE
jgi:hypothetical protein